MLHRKIDWYFIEHVTCLGQSLQLTTIIKNEDYSIEFHTLQSLRILFHV